MDIAGVDVEIDVIRELPELEDLVVNPSIEEQNFNSNKYGFKSVKIKGIRGEELELNPSTAEQKVEGVFTKVKVNAIKTQKLNTVPSTQEQVIKGLFDEVTVNAIEGQELNLNPSEEQQNFEGVFLGVNINPIQVEEITTDLDFSNSDAIEITAQEGAYIKKATINKDVNLSPENIKSGVTISGISGDIADTSDADATSDDIVAGKTAYVANEKIEGTYVPLDTSDATATTGDIVNGKTAYVNGEKIIGAFSAFDTSQIKEYSNTFKGNTSISEMKNLNVGGATSLSSTFENCTALETVSLINSGNITAIGAVCRSDTKLTSFEMDSAEKLKGLNYAFSGCTSLKRVVLPITVEVSNKYINAQEAFYNCIELEEIVGTEVPLILMSSKSMFRHCVKLKNIPELSGAQWSYSSIQYMFDDCPSLTDESLNKILQACITANQVSASGKTLAYIGLSSEQATRCQTLSNWQACANAGWITGY